MLNMELRQRATQLLGAFILGATTAITITQLTYTSRARSQFGYRHDDEQNLCVVHKVKTHTDTRMKE